MLWFIRYELGCRTFKSKAQTQTKKEQSKLVNL